MASFPRARALRPVRSERAWQQISMTRWWLGAFGFWSAVAIVAVAAEGHDQTAWVVHELLEYWYWVPVTVLAVILLRRWPLENFRAVGLHAGVALVCAYTWNVLHDVSHFLVPDHRPAPLTAILGQSLLQAQSLITYLGMLAGVVAIEYHRRERERGMTEVRLRLELADARVRALRMQINPHFLFNTLNTVSALVERDPARTRTLVARFSELLRETLEESDALEVPLSRELAHAEKYMGIMEARFGDRVRFEIDVDPDALDVQVPSLLLQPLLENALEHGLLSTGEAGRVRIEGTVAQGRLHLRVEDDGAGPGASVREGIGLRNLRSRLAYLHEAAASLQVRPIGTGGCVAEVVLPVRGRQPARA